MSDRFTEGLKRIFSSKRTRITLYIAVVLWLSLFTQILVNRMFFRNFHISEAFAKTSTEDVQCSLEFIAQHKKEFISDTDKQDIIRHIANTIGLKIDKDITVNKDSGRIEYAYQKQAKKALTVLKIVSLEQEADSAVKTKHYIIVRLKIKDSIQSLDKFRNLLEKAFDELDVEHKQITMQYEGYISKLMNRDEQMDMANELINELQGEIAFDYWQDDNYSVYAYTGMIDEYIETAGCKINLQIAMTYDDETEKTKIYLATPIINQDW